MGRIIRHRCQIKYIIFYILLFGHFILEICSGLALYNARPLINFLISFVVSLILICQFFEDFKRINISFLPSKIVIFYFIYNLALFIIGFFICHRSQRNELISYFPSFFFPLLIFYFSYWERCLYYVKWVLLYLSPIALISTIYLFVFTGKSWFGFSIYAIYFLLLFLPYFSKFYKITLLVIVIVSAYSNLVNGQRGAFLSPLFMIACVYAPYFVSWKFINKLKNTLFISLSLFLLAIISGNFIENKSADQSFLKDTRTFLYKEIWESHVRHHSVLWGTTPGIGYKTSLFKSNYYDLSTNEQLNYRNDINFGRLNSEAQMANLFHWGGVINVILITLLYYFILSYGCKYINNNLGMSLILFVLFRYYYSYIEGIQTCFEQYMTLWISMALILNRQFLCMSNEEIEYNFRKLKVK